MNKSEANSTEPIRVFVAATPSEWLPAKVLEFSIREIASLPVEIASIYTFERKIPEPRDVVNRARTPFSFQRFLIPELASFTGRAIYLDSDMQVFRDIAEVWRMPFSGADLLTVAQDDGARREQFSVMLLDCANLHWNIDQIVAQLDSGAIDYASLMHELCIAKIRAAIPSSWNSLERYIPGVTSLLHYTDMNTQPWVSTNHPLGAVWMRCLRRAINMGFIAASDIDREVSAGHVRPTLLHQLEAGIDDGLTLSRPIRRQDSNFTAPYRKLRAGSKHPWTSPAKRLLSGLRRAYFSSPLPRFFR
jgi:hypothetical protein